MDLTETLISSSTIEKTSFLQINRDKIQLPNGHQHTRIVIRHPGAACVLAVTDNNHVILVRQWRHAAGRSLLEIPAGKLDAGESPENCALRELAEETPYSAERVEKIHSFYTAPGFCDEIIHLYRAINLTANSTLQPDSDELLETVLLTPQEAQEAITNGNICDAKTLIALQFWLREQHA